MPTLPLCVGEFGHIMIRHDSPYTVRLPSGQFVLCVYKEDINTSILQSAPVSMKAVTQLGEVASA